MLPVSDRIESDYLPLEFNFDLAGCVNVGEEKADLNLFIEKKMYGMTMHSCIITHFQRGMYKKSSLLLQG